MMKTKIALILCLLGYSCLAQQVPLTRENWEGKAVFKEAGVMKLDTHSGPVVLKNYVFKDGTIEYDLKPLLPEFAYSIYFRRKDDKEQEIVYFRSKAFEIALSANGKASSKYANDGIQYAPYLDGINMWDMYDEYQAPAQLRPNEWNRVKLVISGKRLRVFLNHSPKPALDIPELEGRTGQGTLAFEGYCMISNLAVYPGKTGDLHPEALPDITDHDPKYIRLWKATTPEPLPSGTEPVSTRLPAPSQYTETLSAERRGMVNLTRKFGANSGINAEGQYYTDRKIVWLKANIVTREAFKTLLQLGFSDEIWIFLNGKMVLADKNHFWEDITMRKYPNGRISIWNTRAPLQLKAGANELLIGVANDFYGWGLMARLENMEGIIDVTAD